MNRPPTRHALLALFVGVALATAGCASDARVDAEPTAPPTQTVEPGAPSPVPVECDSIDSSSGPTGAVDDPFAPGEPIAVDCFTVVIDSVEKDATDAVIAANPGAAPSDGNVFMTVTLTITREGGGPAEASDVRVVLAGSITTSGDPSTDLVVAPGPPTGTLDVGRSATGTFVFEMSGGASTSVEIAVGSMTPLNVLPY